MKFQKVILAVWLLTLCCQRLRAHARASCCVTDTNLYCFGTTDTLKCLEMGAVEKLIVWEELDTMRLVARNPATGGMCSKFFASCFHYLCAASRTASTWCTLDPEVSCAAFCRGNPALPDSKANRGPEVLCGPRNRCVRTVC